jgi:hypothetical protein
LYRGADLNSVGDGADGGSIRIRGTSTKGQRGTSTKGQRGTSTLPRGQDGADEAVDAISCDSFLVSRALFGWLEGMDDSFTAGAGGLFDRSKLGAGAGAGAGDRVSRPWVTRRYGFDFQCADFCLRASLLKESVSRRESLWNAGVSVGSVKVSVGSVVIARAVDGPDNEPALHTSGAVDWDLGEAEQEEADAEEAAAEEEEEEEEEAAAAEEEAAQEEEAAEEEGVGKGKEEGVGKAKNGAMPPTTIGAASTSGATGRSWRATTNHEGIIGGGSAFLRRWRGALNTRISARYASHADRDWLHTVAGTVKTTRTRAASSTGKAASSTGRAASSSNKAGESDTAISGSGASTGASSGSGASTGASSGANSCNQSVAIGRVPRLHWVIHCGGSQGLEAATILQKLQHHLPIRVNARRWAPRGAGNGGGDGGTCEHASTLTSSDEVSKGGGNTCYVWVDPTVSR